MSRNLLTMICSLLLIEAFGQSDSSGIFMSATDYERNRLTLPVCCKAKKNAIKPHSEFEKKIITLRFKGKKYKYVKDKIFGYRNCENETFRFFLDGAYEIINTDGFWLYRQKVQSENWNDFRTYTYYYFSKDPYSIIYPLTKHDLKFIFKERPLFTEALDSSFSNDDALCSFNSTKKKYRIVEMFLNFSQK